MDGLHAVQRDVHLVSDQHALPDMELVGFQVKCEAGEVQHRAQEGQGAPCSNGPNEKPGVPVALEIKSHEDRPRRAHQAWACHPIGISNPRRVAVEDGQTPRLASSS